MTSILIRLFQILLPSLALEGTPWIDLWRQKERRRQKVVSRTVFGVATVGYPLHIYLDRMTHLQPEAYFLRYRIGLTTLSILLLGLTRSRRLFESRFFNYPLMIGGICYSVMQAVSTTWDHSVPFFFALLLGLGVTLALQQGLLFSLCYFSGIFAYQAKLTHTVWANPVEVYSLTAVCLILIIVMRSRHILDIESFNLTQEQIETQGKLISLQQEYYEQIRAFLPRKIYQRFEYWVNQRRMPILQAMDVVLRPTKKQITCLFSDIRGFTQGTKILDQTVEQGILANIQKCTDLAENQHGIPRLVGDLLLTYFDDESMGLNLVHSFLASVQICQFTEIQNKKNSTFPVKRFCLLASGEAIVGNIGGYNSSRDITPLGSVVNILSRIDPVTKNPRFQLSVGEIRVICTKVYFDSLISILPGLEFLKLDLDQLEIVLRDFPEERELYGIPLSNQNLKLIESLEHSTLPQKQKESEEVYLKGAA